MSLTVLFYYFSYGGIKWQPEDAILKWSEIDHSRSTASGYPGTLPPECATIGPGCPQDVWMVAQAGPHLNCYVPHPDGGWSDPGTLLAESLQKGKVLFGVRFLLFSVTSGHVPDVPV